MAPTLSDLPVEIFDAIIDQLPKGHALADHGVRTLMKDLKSLRQTCRQVESQTRRRFAKTIFGTVSMDILKLVSLQKADAALGEETFQEHIRFVHAYFSAFELKADNTSGWDVDATDNSTEVFHRRFRNVLEKAQCIESLQLSSPRVSFRVTPQVTTNIERIWHQVFQAALTVILDRGERPARHFVILYRSPPHQCFVRFRSDGSEISRTSGQWNQSKS